MLVHSALINVNRLVNWS